MGQAWFASLGMGVARRFAWCGAARRALSRLATGLETATGSRGWMHRFCHPEDTLAFRNETEWVYWRDPVTGRQAHRRRDPPPAYALRCFVMARVVRQFHRHAVFDPSAGPPGPDALRRLVRGVLATNPRAEATAGGRVRIPGWGNLRDFSVAEEGLLKEEAGGAWQSYVQRGHWWLLFPFSRASQEREARRVAAEASRGRGPALHVFTFPALTINHAIMVVDASEGGGRIRFGCYDPNEPGALVPLEFDLGRRRFHMPATPYFIGGPVRAYEVLRGFWR
jgi:hypothetical protein